MSLVHRRLGPGAPILACDPRHKEDVKKVLLGLLGELLERAESRRVATG
jgi:hypothetical protein